MARLHAGVRAAIERLAAADWERQTPVIYRPGEDPYATSPEDIVGWLTDHYREHVTQCADLIAEWSATGRPE
jgi:hypothetical protein